MRIASVAIVLVGAAVLACRPVVPQIPLDVWSFEGFEVRTYVPADPVGLVYFFHGTNGSAGFAAKVEATDVINELGRRGYGIVATESTQRTGLKRWDVSSASMTANPDLARLARLHEALLTDYGLSSMTPIFGIGMSNGARMVSLFGQAFWDAGHPVAAVVPHSGKVANPVRNAGGLTVPALFLISENDTTVDNDETYADYATTQANGVATLLLAKPEEPISWSRFVRIPEIDQEEAVAVYDALVATGIWDATGVRAVSLGEAESRIGGLSYPVSGSDREIRNQLKVVLALHQFTATYRIQIADFFDARLP